MFFREGRERRQREKQAGGFIKLDSVNRFQVEIMSERRAGK